MRLDLNVDLGEGEPFSRTRALMRCATSVNIACGVHAGDAATMTRCLQLAKSLGVRAGAHPGSAGDFGRAEAVLTPLQLETMLLQQVGALHRLAVVSRFRLHHIKLHGALYHATERDEGLARAYLQTVRRWFRGMRVHALSGGRVAALSGEYRVKVWEEAFLDRAYRADGSLVPRSESEALITREPLVHQRLCDLIAGKGIVAADGTRLRLHPKTLCIHADSPHAVRLGRLAKRVLSVASLKSAAKWPKRRRV